MMPWPTAPLLRARQPEEPDGPFVHVRLEERELGRPARRRVVASLREPPQRFAADEATADDALERLGQVPPEGWRPPWAANASGFDVFVEDLVNDRTWSGWLNSITDLGSVFATHTVGDGEDA